MKRMLIFALLSVFFFSNSSFDFSAQDSAESESVEEIKDDYFPGKYDRHVYFEVDQLVLIGDDVTCEVASTKYHLEGPYEMVWIHTPSNHVGYHPERQFNNLVYGVWDDQNGLYVLMIVCDGGYYVVEGNHLEGQAPFELA